MFDFFFMRNTFWKAFDESDQEAQSKRNYMLSVKIKSWV